MTKTCSRCVMDTTDQDIYFDREGICNYCRTVEKRNAQRKNRPFNGVQDIVETLKKQAGKYDCLIGISGGVDSCYVAHLAHKLGLNPLLVHCDNGWNSHLAVQNINNIIEKTGFDYQTIVLDWEEIRDLQRAYLKSSVVDIDMVTDHAISATVFKVAKKNKIKYLLTGNNDATENCMPKSWFWRKSDKKNIKAIHQQFGSVRLRHYPMIGPVEILLYRNTRFGPTPIDILNYTDFNKAAAVETLKQEYGWQYYGGKHYESIFTKFYQAHILPVKFGIDKRKGHFSALIRNGEMTRDEALKELESPAYDAESLQRDKAYFLDKLGFSEQEFAEIMSAERRPHEDYGTDSAVYKWTQRVLVK